MTSSMTLGLGVCFILAALLLFIFWGYRYEAKRSNLKLTVVSSLVLLFSSVSLYWYWGASSEFVHVRAYENISTQLEKLTQETDLTLEQALAQLDQLIPTIRHSHKALARLAGVYAELGQLSTSSDLLNQAMILSPNNSEYAIQWIYHQSFLNQGKLPEKVRARAEQLLSSPQAGLAARNMLAMDDYFQGRYEQALTHWDKILTTDESLTQERREVLERAVANAKAKMVESKR